MDLLSKIFPLDRLSRQDSDGTSRRLAPSEPSEPSEPQLEPQEEPIFVGFFLSCWQIRGENARTLGISIPSYQSDLLA